VSDAAEAELAFLVDAAEAAAAVACPGQVAVVDVAGVAAVDSGGRDGSPARVPAAGSAGAGPAPVRAAGFGSQPRIYGLGVPR